MPFLLPALIAAGANLAGGMLGRAASGKASKQQQEAILRALQEFQRNAGLAQEAIWRQTGESLHKLADTEATSRQDISAGLERALSEMADVEGKFEETYGKYLSPYTTLGELGARTLAEYLTPDRLLGTFKPSDMYMDPGYQFRLEQGMKAMERQAAARGQALGGAAQKALQRYAQGLASEEYQRAFDRWRAQQGDIYQRLMGAVQAGMPAAQTTAQAVGAAGQQTRMERARAIMDAARQLASIAQTMGLTQAQAKERVGQTLANLATASGSTLANLLMGMGAAAAQGTLGGYGALAQGISGAGGNLADWLILDWLLKGQRAGTPGGGG